MGSGQESLLLQELEVPADGCRTHVEVLAQLGDTDRAVGSQTLEIVLNRSACRMPASIDCGTGRMSVLALSSPRMSETEHEIASQPECWREASSRVGAASLLLPQHGEHAAIVGCGTSWFIGQAYAALREAAGHGRTDAFAASETPPGRTYDRWIALSRSGTTTEVARLVQGLPPEAVSVAISAVPGTPIRTRRD